MEKESQWSQIFQKDFGRETLRPWRGGQGPIESQLGKGPIESGIFLDGNC